MMEHGDIEWNIMFVFFLAMGNEIRGRDISWIHFQIDGYKIGIYIDNTIDLDSSADDEKQE